MNLFAEYELGVLSAIQSLKCGFLDAVVPPISFLGNAGIIWIAASLALMCFKKTRRMGVTVAAALIISLVLNNFALKNIVARARPFQIDPSIELLISPPGEYSFPSGHTLTGFAAATAMFYYRPRIFGAAAFALSAILGFTRLYLRVHFLSDVIGGAITGVFFGFLAIAAVNAIYGYMEKRRAAAKE